MSATARSTEESPSLDLPALRQMTYVELDELYRNSKRPNQLSDLNGDAIGAMLAWRKPASGPLAALLRSLVAQQCFPGGANHFRAKTMMWVKASIA